MEMALIENIQREDLNPVEIALNLSKAHRAIPSHTRPAQRARREKRATIANYLRLLKLPAEIQIGLKNKQIDMGHARALLSVDNPARQLQLYEQIQEYGYSVRKVEELAKEMSVETPASHEKKESDETTGEYDILRHHLSEFFKTPVQFTCNAKGKGKISIPFKNEEELERLIALFDKLK